MDSKIVTVGTTTTAVITTEAVGTATTPTIAVVKAPADNVNPVLIGGPTTGDQVFELLKGESVTIPFTVGGSLYAHVAAGTEDLEVLWN